MADITITEEIQESQETLSPVIGASNKGKIRRLSLITKLQKRQPPDQIQEEIPTKKGRVRLSVIEETHMDIKLYSPSKEGKIIDKKIAFNDKQLQKWQQNTYICCTDFEYLPIPSARELLKQPSHLPMQWNSNLKKLFLDHIVDDTNDSDLNIDISMNSTSPKLIELGKRVQETRNKELAVTVERLQDLHGSILARPADNEKVQDPRGLKVQLMPHQQHALTWLLWREGQNPSGGVLADDTGLGKTLTMIALIMTTLIDKEDDKNDDSDDESDDEWTNKNKPLGHRGGTLVVCPASLLSHWEGEVQNKCKCGLLSIKVHHGSSRLLFLEELATYDIVLTTYNILSREYKNNSTLYKINWKRIILDEAHLIRNYKSQRSEAVCGLKATKRWAVTGTPIRNKELEIYSVLRFLKCRPFDDLSVWKQWVDNKTAVGRQRLATVIKRLMLRRTKQDLMAKGDIESSTENHQFY